MIALVGATGRSGAALARALHARAIPFRAVVRDAARWAALGIPAPHALADLADARALRAALAGAATVASCAHARHAPALLAATGAPLVLMGSTRRHSRWPDAHGDGVRLGEAAFRADGRPGVLLHPTMIYGAQGEDNVQRLAALMRRLPVLPLPGGGRALVQPIHQDDVTACLLAALRIAHQGPRVLDVAGPEALPYRDFCAAVARAAGLRPRPVVPLPAALLMAAAPLARLAGVRLGRDEVRRLTEDKAFDTAAMRHVLGVIPRPLAEGLRLTFA
ncbi:NAD-dependent epimerase/dehydratase family protein [Roseococcus sp. DSY-14]|uniref:NAD-dependent epimerase/dehydratase family protein n=1 Tax=Roseococcus sp. DSY-14 TaxID=3369650 RepID=UPI00387B7FD1